MGAPHVTPTPTRRVPERLLLCEGPPVRVVPPPSTSGTPETSSLEPEGTRSLYLKTNNLRTNLRQVWYIKDYV